MKARQEMTKTFVVDYNSSQDGMRYQGSFTIKKLGIRDIAALGVRKSQLNGGMYYDSENPGRGVDEQTDDFNNMIAHFELSIKASPEWWNLDQITDVDLLGHIFKEVISFERSFLDRKRDEKLRTTKSGSNGEGSGAPNVSETNAPRSAGKVVGEEVSAALEP